MVESLIRLRAIDKAFGRHRVLRGVTLQVGRGDVVGLVGLNGSGKSTLIKVIAGVIRPDAGEGESCGVPLGGARNPFCGLMLEHPPFVEEFSGIGNLIALADLRRKVGTAQIEATLAQVGLDPGNRRAVRHYSQGMRQRLGLAQAIMERPPLLLLDEPLNGLDPSGILDVRRLLRGIAAQGVTILFSSHVLSEVQKVCSRVCVISGGHLSELDASDLASAESLEGAYRAATGYADA